LANYTYTFTFKQNDAFVEFITTDKVMVDSQLEKWIQDISKQKPSFVKAENPIEPEKEEKAEIPVVEDTTFEDVVEKKEEEIIKSGDFSEMLDQKIKSTELNVKEKETVTDKSFKDILESKSPKDILDNLIITAYYLSEFESLDRFSLKQINSKVFNITKKPVDHSVIQKAVSKGYLKILPDYTGMADVTEYAITSKGEKYYLNEL